MGNQQGQQIPTDDQPSKKNKGKQKNSVTHHQTSSYSSPAQNTSPPPTQQNKPPSTPTIDLLSAPIPEQRSSAPTNPNQRVNTLTPIQSNAAPNLPISKHPSQTGPPIQSRPNPQLNQQSTQPQRQPVQQSQPNTSTQPTSQIPTQLLSSDEFLCGQSPQCGTSYSACHLNITGLEQVTVECVLETKTTNFKADHWLVYVPIPPLTSFQGEGKVTIKLPSKTGAPMCKKMVDPHGRELLQVVVPVDQNPHFTSGLKILASFEVSLFTRELFYDPNVQIPYQVATNQEIENATSDASPFILRNSDFQKYINTHKNVLYRNQSEVREEAIIYAQRVYHFIAENFSIADNVTDSSLCKLNFNYCYYGKSC